MLLSPAIIAAQNIRHSTSNITPLTMLPPGSSLDWYPRRLGIRSQQQSMCFPSAAGILR
jgi:hypothetical protein